MYSWSYKSTDSLIDLIEQFSIDRNKYITHETMYKWKGVMKTKNDNYRKSKQSIWAGVEEWVRAMKGEITQERWGTT